MNAKDLIRKLISETPGTSQNKLGARMGFTNQAMSHRFRADDPKIGFVVTALEYLGYELVAVPAGSKLPHGAVKLDGMETKLEGDRSEG